MANTGFRGSIINIADVSIRGSVLRYRVLFTDTEGFVHAHTQHELETSEDPALQSAIKALIEGCQKHAERTHFASPSTTKPTKQGLARGIAESVSGLPDAPDEPGEAG